MGDRDHSVRVQDESEKRDQRKHFNLHVRDRDNC